MYISKKTTITVFILTIILTFFLFIIIKQNTSEQDVISLLKQNILEEQIFEIESKKEDDNSITLVLHTNENTTFKSLSPFDITSYKGTKLYDELMTLIKENDMEIENTEIKITFVSHKIKRYFFYEEIIPRPIYIIKENGKNTIIYTNIPKGVAMLINYKTQLF